MATDGVQIPISDFVKQVARESALTVIDEHVKSCPIAVAFPQVETRVRKLEVRFGTLIGLMCGSGVLGGGVVGAMLKLL